MERVLVLVGDAAEDLEVMFVKYRFEEAGYAVDLAALSRRPVQLVVHDFDPGSDAYVERLGRRVPVELAFEEVDPDRYAALVIPGGRAPEYIRLDADVARIVTWFFERDLPVGTICHGPQVLMALGLLEGRTTSGFPPLRPDVENAGGTFVEGPAVIDGNMVSCTGWPDLGQWSKAFMEVLQRSVVTA